MAQILSDDGVSVTIQADDGSVMTLPGDMPAAQAARAQFGAPAPEPATTPHMAPEQLPPPAPAAVQPPQGLMAPDPGAAPVPETPDLIRPPEPEPEMTFTVEEAEAAEQDLAEQQAAAEQAAEFQGINQAAQQASPELGTAIALQGQAEQRRGVDAAAEAAEERGRQEAAALQAAQERQRQIEQERQRVAAERAELEEQAISEKQELLGQLKDHKVDRNRRYASMSTGSKVGLWLSIAMTGAGQALKRQGDQMNPAIGMLEAELDNDVRIQMAEREKLGQLVNFKQGQIADIRAHTKNQMEEYSTRMAAALQDVQTDLEIIQAKARGPQEKAQAQQLHGAITERMGQHLTEAGKYRADQEFRERQAEIQARNAAASRALQRRAQDMQQARWEQEFALDQQKALMAAEEAKAKMNQEGAANVLYTPAGAAKPMGQFARDDKEGNRKFIDRTAARYNLGESYKRLMTMADKYGAVFQGKGAQTFLNSTEGQEFVALYERVFADQLKQMSGAQVSDAEVERHQKYLPPPESWLSRDPTKAWKEGLNYLARQQNSENRTYLAPRQGENGGPQFYDSGADFAAPEFRERAASKDRAGALSDVTATQPDELRSDPDYMQVDINQRLADLREGVAKIVSSETTPSIAAGQIAQTAKDIEAAHQAGRITDETYEALSGEMEQLRKDAFLRLSTNKRLIGKGSVSTNPSRNVNATINRALQFAGAEDE